MTNPEPSKYIQAEARKLIGENAMFKTFSYAKDSIVCVIGKYNAELGRMSTWGTGHTWRQALRLARQTALANGWVKEHDEKDTEENT